MFVAYATMRWKMNDRSIGKEIAEISRTLSRFVDKELADINLSNAALPFLTQLYKQDGVHQEELAEKLHFDKSSTARALNTLEKAGYVYRVTDENNKRRNIVYVSAKGLAIKEELLARLKLLTERLFDGFSDEDKDNYFNKTVKLRSNLMNMIGKDK